MGTSLVRIRSENIVVEEGAIPFASQGVVTLNTRTQDELIVLWQIVHEQFHIYAQNHPNYSECIAYLKSHYEDDGEHNRSGNYPNSYWEHIIVCWNTRNFLLQMLSPDDAKYIYSSWQPYPTLEKLIEKKFQEIETALEKYGLVYEVD